MCTWKLDDDRDYTVYSTECQNLFMFEADGPVENNFNYCPYCGDVLHVSKAATSSEDSNLER